MNVLTFTAVMVSLPIYMVANAAYVVPQPGMAPMGVSAPLSPVNGAECEAFVKESSSYQSRLSEWHQQCLDSNRNCKAGKECSCGACEGLHTARSRFSSASSEEAKTCFGTVSKARQAIHQAIDTSDVADLTQKALLSGASGAVMRSVRKLIAEALVKESVKAEDFKAKASETNASLRVAQSSARLLKDVQGIRESCHKQVGLQAAADCEKQVLLSLKDYQSLSTSNNSLFVRAIQRNAFNGIDQINSRVLEQLRRGLNDQPSQTRHRTETVEDAGQTLSR
jgi:hypothetical protein